MKAAALLLASLVLATGVHAQQFEFHAFSVPADGRLVIPVGAGETPTGVAATIDDRTGGALSRAMVEADFEGKAKSSLTLYGVGPYVRVDLIGLGSDAADRNAAENAGGLAASLLADTRGGEIQVLWQPENAGDDATAARFAFGYLLRSYRFDRYQEDRVDPAELPVVHLLTDDGSGADYENDLAYLAEGVYFARNMSSEPGNLMYPEAFVDLVKAGFKGLRNVKIRVLDERDLQRLDMGAHWGVGKGSSRPPRLLIIEYMGASEESAPIALVGKGITFDTGGISLKRNDGMWAMKGDLGGAGVVTGTILAAAKRGAPVNVVAMAALAENMPSGTAIRPGDVLTTMSGLTVEIRSTDAEGRLVLSDAVYYAQETYSPPVLIDVATLTGSVGRALGDDYAGIFGREAHQGLIDDIAAASRAANEAVWQLPLDASHFKQIESDYADIKNSGTGSPGASTGAAFIGSFVEEDQVWAHLDIAGVDLLEKAQPTVPKGYSGWGVRTLDEYLRRHHEE